MKMFARSSGAGAATLGSMGSRSPWFAETPSSRPFSPPALSALYYADRLNQLPIGVIASRSVRFAAEMSRRLTADDHAGAAKSQRRAFDFTLLFLDPVCCRVPHRTRRHYAGDVARGAFSKADAPPPARRWRPMRSG